MERTRVHFRAESVDAVIRCPTVTELECLEKFHAHLSACISCQQSLLRFVKPLKLCSEGKHRANAILCLLQYKNGKTCAAKAICLPYNVVVEISRHLWATTAVLGPPIMFPTLEASESFPLQRRISLQTPVARSPRMDLTSLIADAKLGVKMGKNRR